MRNCGAERSVESSKLALWGKLTTGKINYQLANDTRPLRILNNVNRVRPLPKHALMNILNFSVQNHLAHHEGFSALGAL